ncbi:hypothetical protein [Pantanalinema sp. GBBB05]|uniref:hypothetical protein n=1 Tax=Pantanalinema sp. GBBB05 TaxID=2604139 RepID=UPI001E0FC97F|nr:hypothetical protein [Pantanalinema sp. GBBB05]
MGTGRENLPVARLERVLSISAAVYYTIAGSKDSLEGVPIYSDFVPSSKPSLTNRAVLPINLKRSFTD